MAPNTPEHPTPATAGPKRVCVCGGGHCHARGSDSILEAVMAGLGLRPGEKNADWELEICSCRDFCEQGPNVQVEDRIITNARPETIVDKIKAGEGFVPTTTPPPEYSLTELFDDLVE